LEQKKKIKHTLWSIKPQDLTVQPCNRCLFVYFFHLYHPVTRAEQNRTI